jgi:hypothetical protein
LSNLGVGKKGGKQPLSALAFLSASSFSTRQFDNCPLPRAPALAIPHRARSLSLPIVLAAWLVACLVCNPRLAFITV